MRLLECETFILQLDVVNPQGYKYVISTTLLEATRLVEDGAYDYEHMPGSRVALLTRKGD